MNRNVKAYSGRLRGIHVSRPLAVAAMAASILSFSSTTTLADKIVRKDGRILEGIIVHSNDTTVSLRYGNGEARIPRSEIAKIIPGTEADHTLLEAKTFFKTAKPIQGINKLGQAARQGVDAVSLAIVMLNYSDAITLATPEFTGQAREDLSTAVDMLESVRIQRQGDLLVARIRWRLQLDDLTDVRRLLTQLQNDHPRTLAANRIVMTSWFGQKIDAARKAKRFSEAIDLIVQLKRIDRGLAGSQRADLALQRARYERDLGNYDVALEIYLADLMESLPQIALDRIADALDEAERSYRENNELGRAIELYEKFGLPHLPEHSRAKIVALWADLGRQYLQGGEFDRARRTFARCEELIPGSADREFILCDYFEQKTVLGPENYDAHYRLGEWCVSKELYFEARSAFEVAAYSPKELLRLTAEAQIRRVEHEIVQADLVRLMDLYAEGEYGSVVNGLNRLGGRPMPIGLRKDADRLRSLTSTAIQIADAKRPNQAEIIRQQAERAYFNGDRARAANLLYSVITQYNDTPAAALATNFYRAIQPRLTLDRIERRGVGRPALPFGDPDPSLGAVLPQSAEKEDPRSTALEEEIRRLLSGSRATDPLR